MHLIVGPNTGNLATGVQSASTLPYRLGFLDCRFVIPAAAAGNLARARRGLVGCQFGLVVATPAESRAAPGRELVDLGGPVIQTRIHSRLSLCRGTLDSCCARLVFDWLLNP